MSLSISLSNALSGLNASSRGIEVVSNNVSNANTDGYGRRELELGSGVLGGTGSGVQVLGTNRIIDKSIQRDLRLADAGTAGDQTRLEFYSSLDALIGATDGTNPLSDSIAQLEAALSEAASSPSSTARLTAVVDAGNTVANQLNDASDTIQQQRLDADHEIADVVDRLNQDLQSVAKLNVEINRLQLNGRDAASLIDQRQTVIDRIAEVIPLREIERDHGTVALYSTGGAALVDGKAAEFSFTKTNTIVPEMTIQSGALSKLSMNGKEVDTSGDSGLIGGGTLGALFQIRDELAVEAQASLNSVARDLVERFADPSVDATIGATDPGLFTDWGTAFDPLTEVGLSSRIRLNAAVDPDRGGSLTQLRSGLYATTAAEAGDGSLLLAMADALGSARAPVSGPFAGVARTAGGLVDELAANWTAKQISVERSLTFNTARGDELRNQFLLDGVDTDQEMSRLLVLEQSYAANARVISTVDDLLKLLMDI